MTDKDKVIQLLKDLKIRFITYNLSSNNYFCIEIVSHLYSDKNFIGSLIIAFDNEGKLKYFYPLG